MPMANNLRSVFRPPYNLLLLFLLSLRPFLLEAIVNQLLKNICVNTRNFTVNSTYEENLRSLLSSISSGMNGTNGFYSLSSGQSPDRVYGIALCRGDLALSDCLACLKNSSIEILQPWRCPVQKESFIWYDICMIRYSDQPVFGDIDTSHVSSSWNMYNVTSVTEFSQAARELMDGLRGRAAVGNSTLRFAAGNASGPDFLTIYGLAQCTPDLSESQCNTCFLSAIDEFSKCCIGRIGARVFGPNCNMRYEVNQFYEQSAESILAPTPVSPPTSSTNRTELPTKGISSAARTIIIVVASLAAAFLLVISIFCIYRRKVRKPLEKVENSDPSLGKETSSDEIMTAESLQHDFEMVRAATNNFSNGNKLGQGGFGSVYKGTLASGQEIAVKRLSRGQGQGNQEFKTEVLLVARLQHRNLVRLLGFCQSGDERLLIYEFLPNSSLDRFIFDPVKRQQLDWERRRKIIGGIARGLLYLHEDSQLRIVHRDLKPSNILLDAEMNPKISDFGMARLFAMDETHRATNRVVGTFGYMAPEYGLHGRFSVKSDVFSFGVLVLEIVSGQKNNVAESQDSHSVQDLLSTVWRNWSAGTLSNIVDPLLSYMPMNEIQRCVHIGLLCVQENAGNRPNMTSVLLMLNSFSISLAVPSQPAFYRHGNMESTGPVPAVDNSRGSSSNEPKSKSYHGSVDEDPITVLSPR